MEAKRRERMDSGATGRPEFRRLTYSTGRWSRVRAALLREQPMCRACEADGRLVPATVADHIEPHRGSVGKFWAAVPEGLQPLCADCHRRKSACEAKSCRGSRRG
jgi:5-methylcytosine-specific restriction protein A